MAIRPHHLQAVVPDQGDVRQLIFPRVKLRISLKAPQRPQLSFALGTGTRPAQVGEGDAPRRPVLPLHQKSAAGLVVGESAGDRPSTLLRHFAILRQRALLAQPTVRRARSCQAFGSRKVLRVPAAGGEPLS